MIQKKNRGISLIVLIITIVVIIILATAIIVNIAKANMIDNANESVVKQDFKTFQDELTLYAADRYTQTKGKFEIEKLNADKDGIEYTGEDTLTENNIYDILTSLEKSKYKEYVIIKDGKIAILNSMPEKEKKWAKQAIGEIEVVEQPEENEPESPDEPEGETPEQKNDETAPTVPTSLELTVKGNEITALASGSTDENEITYEYSLDKTNWEETGVFEGLENKSKYTVYARAKDEAGNISEVIEKEETTKYSISSVNTKVETRNATITGENPSYDNPVIPVGFKAIETTDATWKDTNNDGKPDGWNNGLVIQDENKNEFVWVPVDGTNVSYTKWNGSINNDYTVTSEKTKDDTLPSGVSFEMEQITKYRGFYVARYEAGLPDTQTTDELMLTKMFTVDDNNKTNIGRAQSKANKIVWNRIDYNNAKIVSEAVVSTNYVQSGLITGTQWDTMLTFLSQEVNVDTDCVNWGNYQNKYGYTINGYYRTQHLDGVYSNGQYKKTDTGFLLLQTGKFGSVVSQGSPKNLFDVAGNVWEWTSEIVKEKDGQSTAEGNKISRGGGYDNYGNRHVASYRGGTNVATDNYPNRGFRFVLYIK